MSPCQQVIYLLARLVAFKLLGRQSWFVSLAVSEHKVMSPSVGGLDLDFHPSCVQNRTGKQNPKPPTGGLVNALTSPNLPLDLSVSLFGIPNCRHGNPTN